MDSNLIVKLPEDFLLEFRDQFERNLPLEKAQLQLRQARSKRIMEAAGSVCIEGIGQLKTSMNPRLFFRLKHAFGHHEGWMDDFLADNPELCAPGYKPKKRSLRHAKTFVNGKPV